MNRDIRLSISFKNHRKRRRLVRLIGLGAEVYLIDLWLAIAVDCPSGHLVGWDEEDIADACGWMDQPKKLVDALVESCWLEKDLDGEYMIHGWCEHQAWACRVGDRADRARFSRLAQVNKDKFLKLKGKGVNAITQDEYEAIIQVSRYADEALADPRRSAGEPPAKCRQTAGEVPAESPKKLAPSPAPSPSPAPNALNTLSDESDGKQEPEPFYPTKKKRQLKGKRLAAFELFWAAFAYKQGKADAADAWLDIPQLTDALVDRIVKAATVEARNRPQMVANGRTPKMPQGWLSARRWEDEGHPNGSTPMSAQQMFKEDRCPTIG